MLSFLSVSFSFHSLLFCCCYFRGSLFSPAIIDFASTRYFVMLRRMLRRMCWRASVEAKRFRGLSCRLQLHERQAVTRLRGSLLPPLLSGVIWSSVMSIGLASCKSRKQYTQVNLSRRYIANRRSARIHTPLYFPAVRPLVAMIFISFFKL